MSSKKRGIVIFGVNNAKVDYIQLAVMAAAFIKKNMPGTNVCLVTDMHSKLYHDGKGRWFLNDYFSDIVILPEDTVEQFENSRAYKDTRYYSFKDRFRNESRTSAYDLSPYDETLLIDSDYLICNNSLSTVWGSVEEFAINKNAIGLFHEELTGAEFRLNPFGIKMYWATVIYFKKTEKAKTLFKLVDHIKDNWDFYKLTYDFPGSMFRNDYAFSIAIHIMNGMTEQDACVVSLPDPSILSALDTDQFFKIRSPSDMSFFVNDLKESWKFKVSRTKGLNVHCMNKLSLINNMENIMEVLNG